MMKEWSIAKCHHPSVTLRLDASSGRGSSNRTAIPVERIVVLTRMSMGQSLKGCQLIMCGSEGVGTSTASSPPTLKRSLSKKTFVVLTRRSD